MMQHIPVVKIQPEELPEKILRDRAYKTAINPIYIGYQRGVVVYKFFDKKAGSGAIVNEQQVQELPKPVIKIFESRTAYVRFKNRFNKKRIQLQPK